MVYLYHDSLVIILGICIILSVLFSIGILGSRKKAIKKASQTWLTRMSPKALALSVIAIVFLIFAIYICAIIISSTLDMLKLSKNLRDSDKIVVKDFSIDYNRGEHTEKDTTITSLNIICDIENFITKTQFFRVVSIRPLHYVGNYIQIDIFKGKKKVDSIVITHDRLATFRKYGENVYAYRNNKSLVEQLRKVLLITND